MKRKITIILILLVIFMTGCNLGNTPNSKVEDLLGKYQKVDNSIPISPYTLTPSNNLSDDIQKRYQKIIENQYKNLTYELKDEKTDGNKATVTVEIEVTDFKSIIEKYDYSSYSEEEYNEKLLEGLENAKEKITYTIDFELTKDDNGKWSVDDLTTDIENKLLGIY